MVRNSSSDTEFPTVFEVHMLISAASNTTQAGTSSRSLTADGNDGPELIE